MVINRREMIVAMALVGLSFSPALANSEKGNGALITGKTGRRYLAARVDQFGGVQWRFDLPSRGHGFALAPDKKTAVVFSRRPDVYAIIFDPSTGRPIKEIQADANRHFFGHALYSADGNYLFATENNFEGEEGILGIYDANDSYKKSGEYKSYGIGPHEALLMSDKKTIAVANGGILTHPDFPRQKLNLSTMKSSIAYIDILTGQLIDRAYLTIEHQQLSIRHIAETTDGTIWYGGQYQGNPIDTVELVGSHKVGQSMTPLKLTPNTYQSMRHYVGSIAVNRDQNLVAVSCPRGNRWFIFDASTNLLVTEFDLTDVCALASNLKTFSAYSGSGEIFSENHAIIKNDVISWDNHACAL